MHKKKEEKGGQQASVKGYFVILRPVYCLASINIFLCYIFMAFWTFKCEALNFIETFYLS